MVKANIFVGEDDLKHISKHVNEIDGGPVYIYIYIYIYMLFLDSRRRYTRSDLFIKNCYSDVCY
ncbi:hypothetical protein Hanom_Chr05g00457521 [Helianthus anomalus]